MQWILETSQTAQSKAFTKHLDIGAVSGAVGATSFPGSLILTSGALAPGVNMRDPGNEVAVGAVCS